MGLALFHKSEKDKFLAALTSIFLSLSTISPISIWFTRTQDFFIFLRRSGINQYPLFFEVMNYRSLFYCNGHNQKMMHKEVLDQT